MLSSDRNKLFNIAYGMDNRTRLYIPKRLLLKPVPERTMDRLRMQGKEDTVFVVMNSREYEQLADDLRTLAAFDEALLRKGGNR